jgi:hypothetical protein
MQKFCLLVLLLIGLTALQSCRCSKENNAYTVGIDLQSDFKNDVVSVEIDGQRIFQNRATTNEVAGMAESIRTRCTEGIHTIRITVNGITKADQFNLTKCQFLGINYFSAMQQISISYYNQPFSY